MDDKTLQIIKESFDSLPQGIQDLIMSDYYQNSLVEIGKKYQLNVEQLGIIEREVTMSLMGLTLSGDFEGTLTKELGVDREKGRNISQEVSDKVFAKVRELMQLNNIPKDEEILATPAIDPLKSAGIEITPPKPKVEFQTPVTKNDREDMLKKIENPSLIGPEREIGAPHPIHQQKLAGSFQIPKTETHYEEKPVPPANSVPPAGKEDKKASDDPYREPIK